MSYDDNEFVGGVSNEVDEILDDDASLDGDDLEEEEEEEENFAGLDDDE